MAYDDNAKRLAIKAIGTVESRLNYTAINYGDPITVGIMQWYGTRAANLLTRTINENIGSWIGVGSNGDTIAADLRNIPATDTWWNQRRLTQAEGEALRPMLDKNRAIQDHQAIADMEVYKDVAINNGINPDTNTQGMIFFFSMYHQGPVYAFQVLNAVGPDATLEQFRNGALANPVLGQYSNRYNEVYEIVKSGDISGTEPPADGETPESGGGDTLAISYLEPAGQSILIHFQGETITCYPTGAGRWLPERQPAGSTPAPEDPADPTDPPDTGNPETPAGGWTHPLPGAVLTSAYGPRDLDGFHAGTDLSTTGGGVVLAPCDLEITQAWEAGTGGLEAAGSFVKGITRSGEKYTFSFFHMVPGSLKVKRGDIVSAGTKLGTEGSSGNVTGRHVHIECWPGHLKAGFSVDGPWYWGDGTPVDPLPILRANGVKI